MIEPAEFRARWRAWYPGAVPRGWAMRPHRDRWLRVHSLPEGKRYPETEGERRLLLSRHNAAADAIVGAESCVLLGYDDVGRYTLPSDHPLRGWLPDAPPVMRLAPEGEDAEAASIFAGRVSWRPGILDGPLLEVAEDRLRLMLLSWESGAAYAPYDGGADLFRSSQAERDVARARFSDWLSADESGA